MGDDFQSLGMGDAIAHNVFRAVRQLHCEQCALEAVTNHEIRDNEALSKTNFSPAAFSMMSETGILMIATAFLGAFKGRKKDAMQSILMMSDEPWAIAGVAPPDPSTYWPPKPPAKEKENV